MGASSLLEPLWLWKKVRYYRYLAGIPTSELRYYTLLAGEYSLEENSPATYLLY